MIEFHDATVVVSKADAAPSDAGVTILHPLTLTLTEQRVSLIGANGSGKSTLARLINGLVRPTSGTVTVTKPHAVANPFDTVRDVASVRRLVGFVFTDPATQLIMPTVIEDVELSLRAADRAQREAALRGSAARRAAARTVLERYGLAHLADVSVHQLSGGQQQLLAIAAVLATEPAILVADEPTTLLDLANTRRIADLLWGLPQQLVVATHDLELAARAERTLVVRSGRVVFDGSPGAAIAYYRETA